jgi:hypothetical protein
MRPAFRELVAWFIFVLLGSLIPMTVEYLAPRAHGHRVSLNALVVDRGHLAIAAITVLFGAIGTLLLAPLGGSRQIIGAPIVIVFAAAASLYALVVEAGSAELNKTFVTWASVVVFSSASFLSAIVTGVAAQATAGQPGI